MSLESVWRWPWMLNSAYFQLVSSRREGRRTKMHVGHRLSCLVSDTAAASTKGMYCAAQSHFNTKLNWCRISWFSVNHYETEVPWSKCECQFSIIKTSSCKAWPVGHTLQLLVLSCQLSTYKTATHTHTETHTQTCRHTDIHLDRHTCVQHLTLGKHFFIAWMAVHMLCTQSTTNCTVHTHLPEKKLFQKLLQDFKQHFPVFSKTNFGNFAGL